MAAPKRPESEQEPEDVQSDGSGEAEEEDSEMTDSEVEDENEEVEEEEEEGAEQDEAEGARNGTAHAGQKRKQPPTSTSQKTGGKAARHDDKEHPATPKQLLSFLLSAEALPYCFPPDELEEARQSSTYKSYSLTSPTTLTPFEHLVCAHLLAKPLSHKLGLRSIRTLLNEPFSFSTPQKVVDAGEKRVWEALEAARTQHRQKTAAYIFGTAEAYADGETMFALSEEANDGGPRGVVEHIKATVPGLGVTGAEIFCRRVQCVDGWGDALWPYADAKSMDALRELGIPVEDADELQSAIERDVDFSKVGDMGLHERDLSKLELAGEQEETQVQAEFVVALERAVGCVLQGNVAEFRDAAAKA